MKAKVILTVMALGIAVALKETLAKLGMIAFLVFILRKPIFS